MHFARCGRQDLTTKGRNGRSRTSANLVDDASGIVWQWTRSAFTLPLSGLPRGTTGALREYNGKFMITRWSCGEQLARHTRWHARCEATEFFLSGVRAGSSAAENFWIVLNGAGERMSMAAR